MKLGSRGMSACRLQKNASASKCAFAKGPVSNNDIILYKEVSMNRHIIHRV